VFALVVPPKIELATFGSLEIINATKIRNKNYRKVTDVIKFTSR
jgi:hypothetical protein